VSLPSRWRSDLQALGRDEECETEELETVNVCVQTAENEDAGIQTCEDLLKGGNSFESKLDHVDEEEDALREFVESTTGLMLDELAKNKGSELNQFIQDDSMASKDTLEEVERIRLIERPKGSVEEEFELACTGISWSASGSIVFATYGKFDEFGWSKCRGSLCSWSIFASENQEEPDLRIMTPSSAMCCVAHPKKPSQCAYGTFSGEIFMVDLNDAIDCLQMKSEIEIYTHREPIYDLKWLSDSYLASASTDGRIFIWTTENKFVTPLKGIVLCSEPSGKKSFGAVAFDVVRNEAGAFAGNFVAGSETGGVCRFRMVHQESEVLPKAGRKWSKLALEVLKGFRESEIPGMRSLIQRFAEMESLRKIDDKTIFDALERNERIPFPNGIRFRFMGHSGTVNAVSCSPYHRKAFLTASQDGKLMLRSQLLKDPIREFICGSGTAMNDGAILDVAWSHHRPAVFAAAKSDGKLYVYDLSKDGFQPVICVEGRALPINKISFNAKLRGYIACGRNDGSVEIIKLPWRLANRQRIDQTALNKVAASQKNQ